MQAEFDGVRKEMEKEAKRAAKLEQKVGSVTSSWSVCRIWFCVNAKATMNLHVCPCNGFKAGAEGGGHLSLRWTGARHPGLMISWRQVASSRLLHLCLLPAPLAMVLTPLQPHPALWFRWAS